MAPTTFQLENDLFVQDLVTRIPIGKKITLLGYEIDGWLATREYLGDKIDRRVNGEIQVVLYNDYKFDLEPVEGSDNYTVRRVA